MCMCTCHCKAMPKTPCSSSNLNLPPSLHRSTKHQACMYLQGHKSGVWKWPDTKHYKVNTPVSNYTLMVTCKRTKTTLKGIKQKKREIIPLSLFALLSVTIRA